MYFKIKLPATTGKNNMGILTMIVGYNADDENSFETLASWKSNTVQNEYRTKLYKLSDNVRVVDGICFNSIAPLSVETRLYLEDITEPTALYPDEGFSASMLVELCSCLYNGAHILIDDEYIPFARYYRLNFPMFKIVKPLSLKRTELIYEMIKDDL